MDNGARYWRTKLVGPERLGVNLPGLVELVVGGHVVRTIAMVGLLALAGCGGSAQHQTSNAVIARAAAAPPHNWIYQEGQEYGYEMGISEDDRHAGTAAPEVVMFRYLGNSRGVYSVAADHGMSIISCRRPCAVLKLTNPKETTRVIFNPATLGGAVLTDAFNGQMAVYDPARDPGANGH